MDGTFLETPSAARTAEETVVVVREIAQLVHKALTEAFPLGGPGLTGGHKGEVRIHTAVPAPKAADFFSVIEFLNVIALTGGAHKGTGAAPETALRERIPLGGVKEGEHMLPVKALEVQLYGQTLENLLCPCLLGFHSEVITGNQHGQLVCERLAFFRVGPPVEEVFFYPAADVSLGVCGVDAEASAETGLGRAGAGQGHNGGGLAAAFVEGVLLFRQKYPVQDIKAPAVTGADTEDHKGGIFRTVFQNLNGLSRDLEVYQTLHLGKEQVLGAAGGVSLSGQLHSLDPGGEMRLGGGVVCGDVQCFQLGNGGKQGRQLG